MVKASWVAVADRHHFELPVEIESVFAVVTTSYGC